MILGGTDRCLSKTNFASAAQSVLPPVTSPINAAGLTLPGLNRNPAGWGPAFKGMSSNLIVGSIPHQPHRHSNNITRKPSNNDPPLLRHLLHISPQVLQLLVAHLFQGVIGHIGFLARNRRSAVTSHLIYRVARILRKVLFQVLKSGFGMIEFKK